MSSNETLFRSGFLVMLALADQPRHGLAIIDRIEEATRGEVLLGPGTLYGTIHKLIAAGHIREADKAPDPSDHDSRRRYYRLTAKGQRALRQEAVRIRALVRAAVASEVLGDL